MASAPERIVAVATRAPQLPDLRDRLVLVVADCAESRDLLYEMIVLWGGECLEVPSGDEALACTRLSLAAGQRFDLIIIDLNSAGARGLATARRLAAETAPETIPVLFLNDEPCPPPDSAGVPGAFCVEKPLRLVDLQDAVSKVLCGRIFGFPRRTKAWLTTGRTAVSQRILLVEDSPVNQQLVRTLFGKRGHQVAAAENGHEALALLARESFDIILMDMQMSVMDGIELTRLIRRGEGLLHDPRIPIIGVTAHAWDEDHARFRAAGVNHCVTKPFKIQELLTLVERYAKQEESADK